jgi:tRNA A-37 threonylcarbamoyl transferase component Bud32
LDAIVSKPATPNQIVKLQAIRDYLLSQLNNSAFPNRSIGLITQNLLENRGGSARQLADVLDDNTVAEDVKRDLIIFAGAQILRLYLNFRVIHCDLHLGNILVSDDKCFIIDFGRVYSFLSEDYYPDVRRYPGGIKSVFMGIQSPNANAILHAIDPNFDDAITNVAGVRDSTYREIDNIRSDFNRRYNDDAKNNFIRDIFFTEIIPVDTNYLQHFFGQNGYQMVGVMDEIEDLNSRESIYLRIFEKYLQLNTGQSRISDKTIQGYEKVGTVEKPYYQDFTDGDYNNIQFPGLAVPGPVAGPVAAPVALIPPVAVGQPVVLRPNPNGGPNFCLMVAGVCLAVAVIAFKGGKHKRRRTHKNRKTHKRH